MMCSRFLLGEGSHKAQCARLYATTHDSRFLRLYGKYGRTWAKHVERSRVLRVLVRPIWSWMASQGEQMLQDNAAPQGAT